MNMNITMPAMAPTTVAPTTASMTGNPTTATQPGTNGLFPLGLFPPGFDGNVLGGTASLVGFNGRLTVPQAASLARNMADMRRSMASFRADMGTWEDEIRGLKGNRNFNKFCHRVSSYLDYCKGSKES